MANRALMPLHDHGDSERLVAWAYEPLRYSLVNEKLSDWTSFQGCAHCGGLCSTLESADSVRQLFDKQRVPIFKGRYRELESIATRGCKFAKYLMSYLGGHVERTHGLDELIDLAFQRIDETDPSRVRLVKIVQRSERKAMRPLYLAVATAPNDPAHVIASDIPCTDPKSSQTLLVLRYWLGTCAGRQLAHQKCPQMMPIRTKLPTRVVYVGTDDGQDPPRLYPSKGEIAGYVALSYCWGGSQTHQTERNRMEEYMQALPVERLPKSLKDAISLTRALGIQYIWIDSLCIIQDCDEDKDREMTRMAKIYKDAVFTISAARARSCDEGFLGVQEQRVSLLQDSIKLPMNCLNGAIGTVLFYPSRQLSRHKNRRVPIDGRAWTYQEQLLSCRVVSFFNDSIEWSCPSWIMCDDGLDNEELGVTDPLYLRSTTPILERTGYLSPILYRPPEDRQKYPEYLARLHKDWWVAVFEYTMGNLTNLDDRLPAIAGIASEFHDITGDVYVAGLWMSHLIRDLQWEVLARSDESSNNRDFKYYAPTWTWASAHERLIRGPQKEYDFDSDRVEVIDCKVDLVSPFAPFGCVHSGELKIRAPLKFLSDREAEEMLIPGGRFIGLIKRDWRSKQHTDELSTLRGGTASHIEPTGVWCLGLSKSTHLTYESSGLSLEKRADGLFERIGIFQIHKVDTWVGVRTAEQDELWASWGDDYVVTTVTIV